MNQRIIIATALVLVSSPAIASGKIFYGSRAGMQVTVISMSGLDTSQAVIRTRHTRDDAVTFCRDYVGKVTEACIQEELSVRLNDVITANCNVGEFTDFYGDRHRFMGPRTDKVGMANYKIIDLSTGELEDGSSASGYGTNMGIFHALCPRRAPADE
jgi:hypothetical protein